MNDFFIKKYCNKCKLGDGYNCQVCSINLNKCCGNCKHWHEKWEQFEIKRGECDKVAKGTSFFYEQEVSNFRGFPYIDDCYDDFFNCFEGNEK